MSLAQAAMGAKNASIIGLSLGEESKMLNRRDLTVLGGARSAHQIARPAGR
jgi:hypothetical protein